MTGKAQHDSGGVEGARMGKTVEQVDHVAIGVADFEERLETLSSVVGFEVRRRGTYFANGKRLAMLGQAGGGFKIELCESPEQTGLLHLALRVEDVRAEFERLVAAGLKPIVEPRRIEPARADSAMVEDDGGWRIQLIHYDPDSPDL